MPTLRTRPAAESLASRLRQVRQVSRAQGDTTGSAARELILVAFAVPILALTVVVVSVLAVLLLAGSSLSGIASAIASSWLAIHQVPVTLTGVTVGVLPLLPTLLVAATTYYFAGSAARSMRGGSELLAVGLSAVASPLLVTAMSLAIIMDGASVLPLQSPNPLAAFGYTLGIHAVAAVSAIGWHRRADLIAASSITVGDVRGLRYGLIAILALLTAAAAVVAVRLVMEFQQVGDLVAEGNGFDGYLGLVLLSILYLPNLVVGAAAILVGADVRIGLMSVDLFSVTPGALPPLPALGALPSESAGNFGALGLLIPAAIGAFVGWRCRSADILSHIRAVGVASGVVAIVMVSLTALASGNLGEFGFAGMDAAAVGVYTAAWVAVVGVVVALGYSALPSTRAARLRGDELGEPVIEPDYEDDYLAEDYLTGDYLAGDYLDGDYADGDYADDDYADAEYEEAEYEDAAYEEAEYGDAEYEGSGQPLEDVSADHSTIDRSTIDRSTIDRSMIEHSTLNESAIDDGSSEDDSLEDGAYYDDAYSDGISSDEYAPDDHEVSDRPGRYADAEDLAADYRDSDGAVEDADADPTSGWRPPARNRIIED